MKALTLIQPWASLIASGFKRYETRSWGTGYRGLLAIHAGRNLAAVSEMRPLLQRFDVERLLDNMPFGAVLCVVEVLDCTQMTPAFIAQQARAERAFGDWTPGRYAWKLKVVEKFHPPIRASGKQGMWEWVKP